MYAVFFLLSLIAAAVAGSTPFHKFDDKFSRTNSDNNATDERTTIYHLPNDTYPISYNLSMIANLENDFDFAGKVIIVVAVRAITSKIILHFKHLNIWSVSFERDDVVSNLRYDLDPGKQLLNLTVAPPLEPHKRYKVTIDFIDYLNDNMVGFYRSSYKVGSETKWLATTQFQTTNARLAFPCYDEPGIKARFTIHIARHPNQKAMSNMPLQKTSGPDPLIKNRLWDTFYETPPMPTYLVAMLLSEMSSTADDDEKFVVWARENAIDDAAYSQKMGQRLFQQLEEFTGIPYSLPKMDLAAVPDFGSNAAENWGLTLYRESSLLYNPETSPEESKNLVTLTLAHELTHQWFGNYITPKWWDFIWLNEGFATYLEYFTVSQVEPSWRMDDYFLVDKVQHALWHDGVSSKRAMTTSLQLLAEIDEAFDFIAYDKAGAVLRMLAHVVSPSTFNKAVRKYLVKGNETGGVVLPDHLWDAFDEQSVEDKINLPESLTISTIMEQWTNNNGYPLLQVTRVGSNIKIEQKSYKSARTPGPIPDQQWIIPLTFTKQSSHNYNNTVPTKWLLPDEPLVLENEVNSNEWIIFNLQQTGYYRVNYDSQNWQLLIAQLLENPEEIHVLNRIQLLDDSFALAIDEILPFSLPFDLSKYLDEELDIIPWISAVNIFARLHDQYGGTSVGEVLKEFILHRIKMPYQRLGFFVRKGDEHITRISRPKILKLACSLGLSDCVDKAQGEYAQNVISLSNVHPDLKGVVFCTALNHAVNMSVWNNLWSLYQTTNVINEAQEVLMSLKCTKDESLLRRFLVKVMNPNNTDFRRQDDVFIYEAISASPNSVETGIKFIKDHLQFDNLLNPESVSKLTKMLKRTKDRITTTAQMNLLEQLNSEIKKLKGSKYDGLLKELDETRETGALNIKNIQKRVSDMEIALLSSILNDTKITTTPTTPVTRTLVPSAVVSLLPSIASYLSIIIGCVIVNLS